MLTATEPPTPTAVQLAEIAEWRTALAPSIETLTALAGTTENEFLHIGSQLQYFYQRSSDITGIANRLVDSVSGDRIDTVTSRLRQMMTDMEAYLAGAREQSRQSCDTLSRITALLDQASEPLEGFQKMTKTLRMLGISTKIESSRLGEMGAGFQTLAMDVEKLSEMVNEKSAGIIRHRQALASMIGENLRLVQHSETAQDSELSGVLSGTSRSLEELTAFNTRCNSFGALIFSISSEVSGSIGEVVSSMQMHDMTRQQVEHIVEALQRLLADLEQADAHGDGSAPLKKLVIEAGDVCELQSAQLRYATTELCNAVTSIIDNLRDVAAKQSAMAAQTHTTTGSANSGGESCIETISRGLMTVTGVLATCARSDRDMAVTLQRVAETMQDISGFVTDIEEIGTEINLIALNAQVKAAHTGPEGAALGVLAEAVKRLSVDAINQTSAVSEILQHINTSTAHLFGSATEESKQQGTRLTIMEDELGIILTDLEKMNDSLIAMLSGLGAQVGQLTGDIERTTGDIDVHTRVRSMSEQVETRLDRVVEQARELEPASSEFKENLRHMEQRYTMDSERHIHEAIARKSGAHPTVAAPVAGALIHAAVSDESEFGNNVDLF